MHVLALTVLALATLPGKGAIADVTDGARLDLSQPTSTSDGATLSNADHAPGVQLADAISRSPRWGEANSTWFTFGAGTSSDFDELSDINVTVAWSKFISTDFEMIAELAVREFDMPGDDQIGINPMIVFRKHWALDDDRDWSFYFDIGIGILISADDIPQNGTSFNFTPRVGSGFTYQLSDEWRLIAGLRWSHISNARVFGDDDNPSSDGVMFSIGLSTSLYNLFN